MLTRSGYGRGLSIAQQLNQLNIERRQVEAEMKQQALNALQHIQLDNQILCPPHWSCLMNNGIRGDRDCGGTFKEQFHRPSLVFAPDEDGIHIKGSTFN